MPAYGIPINVNRTASGAVAPYRIVRATNVDGVIAQSVSGGEKHIGVSGSSSAVDGERIDITHAGIVPVEYGDDVAFGDALTSDDEGRAVVAVGGDRIIGIAGENGDEGTIGTILLAPGGRVPEGGEFTPTLTAGTNTALTSASAKGFYTRVGDYVTGVIYATDVAHTAGAPTPSTLEASLPVPSAFATAADAMGTVTGENVSLGRLAANPTNERLVASYSATLTGDRDVAMSFAYKVIPAA